MCVGGGGGGGGEQGSEGGKLRGSFESFDVIYFLRLGFCGMRKKVVV